MNPEKTPTTPGQGQGAGSDQGGGSPKKKIAGKFDSLEQAVEEGYVGLERGFNALSQQVTAVAKLLEDALDPAAGDTRIGSGGRADDYGRRDPAKGEGEEFDPAKFVMNPREYLDKRDQKMMGEIHKVVAFAVGNAAMVNDFKTKNPDLAKHERLVATFLKDTDFRKSLQERMTDAAKLTREYLIDLKKELSGPGKGRTAEGGDHIEGPGGEGAPAKKAQVEDDEDLVTYARERNASRASAFSGVVPSK